ncbi:hypothetical protein M5D96_013536 [Drosophila gunungcola]|uniref:Uncharacterized protein n=1 Tax=Drosophila gunungcola TaxID=103775 RepID=A0A9Q0BIS4_9MUSC|nr:hypothetical protein M5D96_013536 [Drosophila gunungcola]
MRRENLFTCAGAAAVDVAASAAVAVAASADVNVGTCPPLLLLLLLLVLVAQYSFVAKVNCFLPQLHSGTSKRAGQHSGHSNGMWQGLKLVFSF